MFSLFDLMRQWGSLYILVELGNNEAGWDDIGPVIKIPRFL